MSNLKLSYVLLLCSGLWLAACGSDDSQTESAVAAETDLAAELDSLYAEWDEEVLALNPINATVRGDDRYNDQWFPHDPLSDEYAAAALDIDQRYLARLGEFDPSSLDTQDRLSFEVFKLERENAIERHERGFNAYEALTPVNQMFNVPAFIVTMGSGATAQPFRTAEDFDNWIARSTGFVEHVDYTILRMREGVETGVVQPRILMEKVLPQLDAQVVEDPEQSPFWLPVANMPDSIDPTDRARIETEYRQHIADVLIPAYRKLHDYIAEDYLPETRETIGKSDVPGGDEYYAFMVRETTTTDLTPQEIHDIGLRESERLFAEMQRIKDELEFDGDMQAFFEHLRSDPQYYFDSEEAIVSAYDELRTTINPKLDALFDIKASADYVVKPVEPFRAQSAAAAMYFAGTPDGSRPGIFYINTYDLPARPRYMMEALSLHEAAPGHHFQISVAQEMQDLPAFRRFGRYTAYIEGWGLYAEYLGKELGLYTDPLQYFGALYMDIWRANRLVVDTGMHAMGWSRQDAIDWMKGNSPITDTDVVAEVERYIAIPSQALAYKLGQLKIIELRQRAEDALGDNFDVRMFHNEILSVGALPLFVLESHIDRWIASQQT